jgi:dienelactone hydrolase
MGEFTIRKRAFSHLEVQAATNGHSRTWRCKPRLTGISSGYFCYAASVVVQLALLLLLTPRPAPTPITFGRAEIERVAGPRAADVSIEIKPAKNKESYSIEGDGKKVRITASDQTGAMYGAYEFAERLERKGEAAWTTKTQAQPFLPDRGLNLFLTLPWDYKKNNTDYEVAALTDPNRWWFANEDYWTTLLDLMAKSRLNWLDIHGGWDISVTNAPNLYAYFVTSPSFPLVGVPQDVKDKDLKQLNHVIDMAHQRGIRVSLMCYEANLKIPQNPNPPYQATEENIYKYTKEVVEQMIRKAPGLDAIGYRIGESGHGESFFKCYGEAIKASGRDIPIVTRSWITRKQKVLPLARASKDFTVEIKYNGEQWGAPYQVAGGRMANWTSYSFEDYLSDSSSRDGGDGNDGSDRRNRTSPPSAPSPQSLPSKKMWPGNLAEGGGTWPAEPYKIVWQVRANGTHRIFPFYNPEWVRRSIKVMKTGTASGYTIEGEDAYYPKSPDYYLANPKDRYCDWIHQRDEMYWMTWGRLGYDPGTPDQTFDARAAQLLGENSSELIEAWKEASVIISKSFMGYAIGPDHRDHAPELEWGGDNDAYVRGQPFDSLILSPIDEERANSITRGLDGRRSEHSWALDLRGPIRKSTMGTPSVQARVLATVVQLMRARGDYVGGRLYTAYALALWSSETEPLQLDWLSRSIFNRAVEAHRSLANNTFFRPFTERLRMHTNTFDWKSEQAQLDVEAKWIEAIREYTGYGAQGQMPSKKIAGCSLSWRNDGDYIVCRVEGPRLDQAWLLVKPLPSSTFFHKESMHAVSAGFETRFKREAWGYTIAAEVLRRPRVKGEPAEIARIPNVDVERPYHIIPSLAKPTPQIYCSEEAMSFLDPRVLTTDKFSGMLIGSRANNFFNRFDRATKRKLLDPVARGMRLVILQEDFAKDRLDFLPKPLRFEAFASNEFDPGGQLALPKVAVQGIMYQRFLPSEGWDIYGNGGLARLKLGEGEVWVTSARLMQTMQYPSAAQAFVQLLSLGGPDKATVLIDACTEGGAFTSSCHQDLMNSHNIPFLTLGEVIAQAQGMNSFTVIPGPALDDDVLNGKGPAMAAKFVRDQVVALSKRPTAKSLSEFEKLRKTRKKELLRGLGLDPMPPRTPLNARVTGRIQRNGYHIEKVVFESRPKFYVTAHVYVPDRLDAQVSATLGRSIGVSPMTDQPMPALNIGETPMLHPSTARYPVIVNVNGHWAHKKNEDRIQLRAAFQATQGYIAIAVDSPGWSFEGDSLIERRPEGNHNDWFLVQGGSNTTGYYVWDCIHALDYMATRPDTDMKHIGLTGASGGGLATLYAFAADDRYTAAVPVVYMSSMETAPDNGCLCNHVPATSQIGDRSDVAGIQAPKPVYIMGAQNDGEFPPDAMRRTAAKMQESWKLFGKDGDVHVQIFAGGHDYNQLMREASIGFFNRYLKGTGDGKPVHQPILQAIDPQDHQLLVLDPPIPGERTMRDLSLEYLSQAPQQVSAAQAIAVNGGRPAKSPLNYTESGTGKKRIVTFESEPGLKTPGILILPEGKASGVLIHMSDEGKAADSTMAGNPDNFAHLYMDGLGTGELSGIDLRYPIYQGRAIAFTAGWQLVRAAEAMRRYSSHIEVVGRGAMSSQAAMWAGLLDNRFDNVIGRDSLGAWSDVFRPSVKAIAIQPRAHLCGSLDNLRKQVRTGSWK